MSLKDLVPFQMLPQSNNRRKRAIPAEWANKLETSGFDKTTADTWEIQIQAYPFAYTPYKSRAVEREAAADPLRRKGA